MERTAGLRPMAEPRPAADASRSCTVAETVRVPAAYGVIGGHTPAGRMRLTPLGGQVISAARPYLTQLPAVEGQDREMQCDGPQMRRPAKVQVTGPERDNPNANLHLRDSDKTMAQSAIVRHLDRRATLLLTDVEFTAWVRTMAEISAEREFLARRLREWSLLRSITVGEQWGPEEVTTGSDWFQRKAVEPLSSPVVLTLLAEAGRTRRVRVDASRRLRQRHRRD